MSKHLWIYAPAIMIISASTAEARFQPQLYSAETESTKAPERLVRPKSAPATVRLTGKSLRPDLEFERKVLNQSPPPHRVPAATTWVPPERKKRKLPPPPSYNLKGWDHQKVWTFSENARKQNLSTQEYTTEVRSKPLLEKYKAALNPVIHEAIRTKYNLPLEATTEPTTPPSPVPFEIWTRRLDALFGILQNRHPTAVTELWRLSEDKSNPPDLQARDALFAAEGALRAGWLRTASMALHRALDLKVSEQSQYGATIWSGIARITDDNDEAMGLINRLKFAGPETIPTHDNRIFYLLAEDYLKKGKTFKPFRDAITDQDLRARADLFHALSLMQEGKTLEAKVRLEEIISTSTNDTRNEALINLARIHLQEGKTAEALLYYGNVKKDGKNRLDVLLETAFAEYRSSDHTGSLGKSVALQSPYFQYGFVPDSYVLEILSRKALCDFGGAEKGLERFFLAYSPELQEMSGMLKHKPTSKFEVYQHIIGSYHSKNPLRYQRYLLHLPAISRRQAFIHSVQNEAKILAALGTEKYDPPLPDGWIGFVHDMQKFHAPDVGRRMQEIETYALEEIRAMTTRLERAFASSDIIRLDIATKATKDFSLQSALNFPIAERERGRELKNKILWPYESEVWEDELDHLRVKGEGKCASRTLASASTETTDAKAAADR